jgi:predicted component of type VI protein secretion system
MDKFISMHSRAELKHAYCRSMAVAVSNLEKTLIQDMVKNQEVIVIPVLFRNLRVNQGKVEVFMAVLWPMRDGDVDSRNLHVASQMHNVTLPEETVGIRVEVGHW